MHMYDYWPMDCAAIKRATNECFTEREEKFYFIFLFFFLSVVLYLPIILYMSFDLPMQYSNQHMR